MKRAIFTFIVIFALAGCSKEPPVYINVSARSAVVMDARTGEVLFEKNADEKLQPASIVKVMTVMVAMDNMPYWRRFCASDSVTRVEPTLAGLKPGIRYRFKDMIKALLVKSANDAAVAVADAVAGSEKDFVRLMNEKARSLGMQNTNFMTASGLPVPPRNSQYITARDAAVMMRNASRYPYVLETMSLTETDICGGDGKTIMLQTHNKSLFSETGASWGKTGYTMTAKRTFVGVDPSKKPKIVIAILRSENLWNDIAALKNGGLKLYEQRHRNPVWDLVKYVTSTFKNISRTGKSQFIVAQK